jgi:biopolymer transport protein ExbD
MRQKCSISPKVFSSVETALLILFVLLFFIVFTDSVTKPRHGGINANLPRALHPIPMPGANREDALLVVVLQDGKVFFGPDQINTDALPSMILDRLKDHSVERKVYIRADVRSKYGTVKKVLVGVRSAGVEKIAFITYQRQLSLGGR